MAIYSKESLQNLRESIDLVEVLQSHLHLQRSGSSFKALCPFHEEKTPSFVVHREDTHYHCFGCGAHGDAITFLMTYVKMDFVDAIESLAERFQVVLNKAEEGSVSQGPSKTQLKLALEKACALYHFLLLYTEEGREALEYLYSREIGLDFIRRFEIGFAPASHDLLIRYLQQLQIDPLSIEQAGLLRVNQAGKRKDFFSDRITFPIRDPMGAVIGFSARKYKEETFGGKYINTPETPLFKKSSVLFGLSYSRMRIAKEKQVIIVEGQIDALRLIDAGLDYTVAGQGTAFGKEHVKELLKLGVSKAYLALDGDKAGKEAAIKIGHLFQKEGVEVFVVPLLEGSDPDALIRSYGVSYFEKLLKDSPQYLQFAFDHFSFGKDLSSPSQKNEVVQHIASMIRESQMPVMVHESLRKLAQIARVPERIFDIDQLVMPDLFVKKTGSLQFHNIDANRILETDLLRWVVLLGQTQPKLIELARANLKEHHFYLKNAWRLFQGFIEGYEQGHACDLLSLGHYLEEGEDAKLLSEILERKVNIQKAEEGLKETLRKMLIRHWMDQREEIRVQIHGKDLSDEQAVELARRFDEIKRNPPELIIP